MADMLIKLYDLETSGAMIAGQEATDIEVRKPIGPEKHPVIAWIQKHFSAGWASEADVALSNQPRTCFIAVREEKIIGFACYDATALGFFGPIGVTKSHRSKGTGRALMKACLVDMRRRGYGYAIAGGVKDTEFYRHTVNAIEIPDSEPGIYANQIKNPKTKGNER